MKNRYRVFFRKDGAARFFGHLDLQTVMQRSVKRANLPVAYSQGFNPHQLISFAQPLALGSIGEREIVDVEMNELMNEREIVERLNNSLPDGLTALDAVLVPSESKSSAALVKSADYEITFPYSEELTGKIDSIVKEILESKEIPIERKTKKSEGICDIRPDILDLINISKDGKIAVSARLSTGSAKNLKPDLLSKCIFEKSNLEFEPYGVSYVRKELYLD